MPKRWIWLAPLVLLGGAVAWLARTEGPPRVDQAVPPHVLDSSRASPASLVDAPALDAYVSPTDTVRLAVVPREEPVDSMVLYELGYGSEPRHQRLVLHGLRRVGRRVSRRVGRPVYVGFSGSTSAPFLLFGSFGTANLELPLGTVLLDPTTLFQVACGTLPPLGPPLRLLSSPKDPDLVGQTIYFQALVATTAGLALTNRAEVTFE